MAKKEPMEAAEPTQPAAEEEVADLDIREVLQGYEEQMGALTGQLIQKNVLIKSLRQQLVEKSRNTPGA